MHFVRCCLLRGRSGACERRGDDIGCQWPDHLPSEPGIKVQEETQGGGHGRAAASLQ
jgi:hypothetical protein